MISDNEKELVTLVDSVNPKLALLVKMALELAYERGELDGLTRALNTIKGTKHEDFRNEA